MCYWDVLVAAGRKKGRTVKGPSGAGPGLCFCVCCIGGLVVPAWLPPCIILFGLGWSQLRLSRVLLCSACLRFCIASLA